MDLRSYYTKVRDAESLLTGESLVVTSLATAEGGKEGVMTEVPRRIAAKLIAEGRARVATDEETEEFHEGHREAKRRYELEEAARRVQVMVIPSQDLRNQKERS
ncbi:MAG: hypothetical protein QOJ99_658 [Bryobacterales bacterium]|jgi:hypothetical protein|nr:hypothetical protein [Bryobacterales bacterium]